MAVPVVPPFDLPGFVATLSAWLFPVIPAAGGLMTTYHAVMKAVSSDDQAAAQHGRAIKTTLTYTAVALGANGLITLVNSFVIRAPGP